MSNRKIFHKIMLVGVIFMIISFIIFFNLLPKSNNNSTINSSSRNTKYLSEESEKLIESSSLMDFKYFESSDPLELGDKEVITVIISEPTYAKKVLIEYEGKEKDMKEIGEGQWECDFWEPLTTGNYPYKIIIEDNDKNIIYVNDSIQVIDTTFPDYSDLKEYKDILELGKVQEVSIKVEDISGINQVLIEFEGFNHSMTSLDKKKWTYNWEPLDLGILPYKIFMEDKYDNWNFVSDYFYVKYDATPPDFTEVETSADSISVDEILTIVLNITDYNGITQVLIEIEDTNRTMDNIIGYQWGYNYTPTSVGVIPFTIYMEDIYNNWNSTSGTLNVLGNTSPTSEIISIEEKDARKSNKEEPISWILMVIICFSLIVLLGIVSRAKFLNGSNKIQRHQLNDKTELFMEVISEPRYFEEFSKDGMYFGLRRGVSKDAEEISEIYKEIYGFNYIYPIVYNIKELAKNLANPDNFWFIAEDVNTREIVGSGVIEKMSDYTFYASKAVIKKCFQGHRIGSILASRGIITVLKMPEYKNIVRFDSDIRAKNIKAQQLIENARSQQYGFIPNFYCYGNRDLKIDNSKPFIKGYCEPAILYTKFLNSFWSLRKNNITLLDNENIKSFYNSIKDKNRKMKLDIVQFEKRHIRQYTDYSTKEDLNQGIISVSGYIGNRKLCKLLKKYSEFNLIMWRIPATEKGLNSQYLLIKKGFIVVGYDPGSYLEEDSNMLIDTVLCCYFPRKIYKSQFKGLNLTDKNKPLAERVIKMI